MNEERRECARVCVHSLVVCVFVFFFGRMLPLRKESERRGL